MPSGKMTCFGRYDKTSLECESCIFRARCQEEKKKRGRSKVKCPKCKSGKIRQSEDLIWLICENCGATFMLMEIEMKYE